MGSVIIVAGFLDLPTRFFHARDDALETKISEADSAELELSVYGARPAAQRTPMLDPTAKFRFPIRFFNLCFACHTVFLK